VETKTSTSTSSTAPSSAGGARSCQSGSSSVEARDPQQRLSDSKWHQQSTSWERVAKKYNLDNTRYDEFKFCTFLDIDDYYVDNYIKFQLDKAQPDFKHRLRNHTDFLAYT
jgi:hypothetical protein